MGSASRLASRVWPACSVLIGVPMTRRFSTRVTRATAEEYAAASPGPRSLGSVRGGERAVTIRKGDVPPVHIVIMGCGRVGSSLAFHLIKRDVSVAIIDQN